MKTSEPIWTASVKAMRWFNYSYSLPKVWWPSLQILSGLKGFGEHGKPLVMTNSISEDFARLWLYFARKVLSPQDYDFLVVDSAGDMNPANFPGCHLTQFLNIYHGKKVDLLLRRFIKAENIFLCDDDKYVINNITGYLKRLDPSKTPVISLAPRSWWKFQIQDREFWPMGSYALLFIRSLFLEKNLRFQSPTGITSDLKIFPPGVKQQRGYDTADYANEQLLLSGYDILTIPEHENILGFNGLSGCCILLMLYGKDYLRQTLSTVRHFRNGSVIGTIVRALYDIIKFEALYTAVFQHAPALFSGFSGPEVRHIVKQNSNVEQEQKDLVMASFHESDETFNKLLVVLQD